MKSCAICDHGELRLVRRTAFPERPGWYRCLTCGSESLLPQPDDIRLKEIYGSSYYEPWTWEQPAVVQRAKSMTFRRILDRSDARAGQRVLDVGCAQGEFACLARDRGLEVVGVDLNFAAVARARERVPEGTFFCGEIEAANAEEPFDLVTMFDVLEHVRSPGDALKSAAGLLKAGGSLLISTPRTDTAIHRIMGSHWPQYREEHLHLLSLAGLRHLFDRVGLRVTGTWATVKYVSSAYLLGQAAAYNFRSSSVSTHFMKRLARARPAHFILPLRFGEFTVVAQRTSDQL